MPSNSKNSSASTTPAKPRLLIVDDDDEIRAQMRWGLVADYDVLQAGDRAAATELARLHHPPVVLLDLGLPPQPNTPEEGIQAVADLLSLDPLTKIIIVSGQGERANAMRAIGNGAYDFLGKPVDMDELQIVLRRAFHISTLERDFRQLQRGVPPDEFGGLLGTSAAMEVVFSTIRKVATTDAPVLVLGESGTGKEMVSRAIHQRSARSDGPFVAINCSAIPETLLESELFGHEKGAFTGAHVQRKGRIEAATGGTLFLDEIGEVSLPIQVKLLRFLQDRCIERVGGRQEIDVDTRIIAATNSDLKKAMASGTFREDLFYRLAVVQISLPPLRNREADTRLLAQVFLDRFAAEAGKNSLVFGSDALRALQRHAWPGNVRELQNRIRRAVVMCDGRRLTAADLDLASIDGGPSISLKEARENLEREMLQQALRKHAGKVSAAAADLGISRPTFYELMDKLGLERTDRDAVN